jgi:orotidine-5'-phosphate decarboxylase
VAPFAVAVKLQSAFFEALGPAGFAAYFAIGAEAREAGLIVIADVKRGDIGSTAEAYAEAFLGRRTTSGSTHPADPPFDAMTVNPLFGTEGIRPFADAALATGKGLFVLVRTSNPTGPEVQGPGPGLGGATDAVTRILQAMDVPKYLSTRGFSLLGSVVGATRPQDIPALRSALPHSLFLLPGVGAQGGSVSALRGAFDEAGRGALVTASRSITYPWRNGTKAMRAPSDWRNRIAGAAQSLRLDVEQALAQA